MKRKEDLQNKDAYMDYKELFEKYQLLLINRYRFIMTIKK
jgi:hypothetical protein